jgi:hypothetical protein
MSGHLSLSDQTLPAIDIPPQSSTSNVNGTAVDMQGWDGCMFVFQIGTVASGGTYDARIVSSANANMSGATNIANAALVQVTSATPNASFIIDVYRPSDRYLRSATQPATAAVLHTSTSIRYRRTGILPPTASATQVVKVALG